MVEVQEIFNRIQTTKKKQKDIKTLYRDALKNSQEYEEIGEKLKTLREKKKQLEAGIKSQFTSEFTQLDAYEADIAADMQLLTDAAVTMMMKGERVEVQDEYNNVYDPIFQVKFKKANS
jgi:predicted nuclease with TOPRIM domain